MPGWVINQFYGISGTPLHKSEVKNYIQRVKEKNPNGVVICLDSEDGTRERIKTQGAFNVFFDINDSLYIDYVGKGFDNGEITKGKASHESWTVPWNEIIFLGSRSLNSYRCYKISDEAYLETVKERIMYLLKQGFSVEQMKGNISKKYQPMPEWIKDMLLEEIIFPIYYNRKHLCRENLKSFGIQGTIVEGRLFPIEFNRRERFAERELIDYIK